MAKNYTPGRGRVYIHRKCGEGTRVSEGDFVGLCNPFEPCTGTFCSSCGRPDDLKRFVWESTGETLKEYRKRLRRDAPSLHRLWAMVLSPLVGAGIGAAIGAFAVPSKPPALNIALFGGGGAFLMYLFAGPMISRVLAGDYFYTQE